MITSREVQYSCESKDIYVARDGRRDGEKTGQIEGGIEAATDKAKT